MSPEQVLGGTLVARAGVVVQAYAGALQLLGRSREEVEGRPFDELIVPEDRPRIRDRYRRRLAGERVPSQYEVTLLLPDGGRRPVEVSVTLEASAGGPDLVVRLRDLSQVTARRRRLAALADLGVTLASERTEAGVLERLQQGLERLGLVSMLMEPAGDGVRIRWARLPEPDRAALEAGLGRPPEGMLGPWTPFARAVWEEGFGFTDDWVPQIQSFVPAALRQLVADLARARRLERAAAVRLDERPGPRCYLVLAGGWLRPDDSPAVRLFGAQVAGALDSARTITELSQRNFELAALDALGALAGEARGLEELLPNAAEVIRSTVACDAVAFYQVLEEEQALELRHAVGAPAEATAGGGRTGLDSPLGRVVRDRRLVLAHLEDQRPEQRAWLERAGFRSFTYVPLVSRSRAVGVMVAGWRRPVGEPEARGDLLLAMGAHVAAAMETHQLLQGLQRRGDDLSLILDLGRRLVSSLDLPEVLEAGVGHLARLVDADGAYLWLLEPDGRTARLETVSGPGRTPLGTRLPAGPGESLVGEVMGGREPLLIEDAEADPRVIPSIRREAGTRAMLGVPLQVRDRSIGAAMIVDTQRPRRFTTAEVQRAAIMANQLAVAVDNARAHARVRDSLERLERAQRRLVQQERLAAIGELAAVVAHEVRNPLGAIFNALGGLQRLVPSGGDARLLLAILGEEADRLDRIVGDLLDFARPAIPALAPERLERVAEEAVAAALAQGPGGVELAVAAAPDLPDVPLDARLVRQALINLASNAVQAMPRGGRLELRLRAQPGAVALEIQDTGPGVPPEVRERIFEPFFTTKAAGTGLGLAVVKGIVEGHGGEIGLEDRPGGGACFVLRFPVPPPAADVESSPPIG